MKINIQFEFRIKIIREERRAELKPGQAANREQQTSFDDFSQRAAAEIERQTTTKSLSTIDNYKTALRSFRLFASEQPAALPFDELTIKRYERWLRSHNIVPNTISCYMRSLRSLAVKIYGDESKGCFKAVNTGREQTEKRAIQEADIARLRNLTLKPQSFICMVRDLFLFSFYALGMPFVDMAFLRKSQIADGQITYFRHKTGQRVSVPLEPCMQEIINRYWSENDEHVFPILRAGQPQESDKAYRDMLNRYNHTLKQLARQAGIRHRLTSYVARHTWASLAYNANVDMPVISKALGHSSPQHTLVYIQQINDSRVTKANHILLEKFSENCRQPS